MYYEQTKITKIDKLLKNLSSLKQQSPSKKPIVLISDGSFNPIHKKHVDNLEVAKKVIEEQEPDKKVVGGYICPSSAPQLKKDKRDTIETNKRVDMIKLATEDSDWMDVDEWECRYGETFPDQPLGMIAASEHLSDSLNLNSGRSKIAKEVAKNWSGGNIEVIAVCGEDTAKKGAKFFVFMIKRGIRTIIVSREKKEGWQKEVEDALNRGCGDLWKGWILFADSNFPDGDKGAALIRDLYKERKFEELKKMLHPKVLEYVKENDIFSEPRERDKNWLKALNLRGNWICGRSIDGRNIDLPD